MGNILEKLRICSLPGFISFIHDSMPIKKDPTLVVTNMRFGTIPVRLFQPKAVSSNLHRGIIFFHGGGTIFGSLVGYRKLPVCHHPATFKDCLNATILFLKALETYEVDPSRVVLFGESFGGWIAASITQIL
ncbi:AADACL4 family member 4 [Apodemus speciosus]|uniref:AADACL4 family member 4 n=1 Tax=Apodemus speciosus TaxID=105296 RepID=A0ABQ0EQ74_APOSI